MAPRKTAGTHKDSTKDNFRYSPLSSVNSCHQATSAQDSVRGSNNILVFIIANDEPFACLFPNCTYRFTSKPRLKEHERNAHPNCRRFSCLCGKKYKKPKVLKQHQTRGNGCPFANRPKASDGARKTDGDEWHHEETVEQPPKDHFVNGVGSWHHLEGEDDGEDDALMDIQPHNPPFTDDDPFGKDFVDKIFTSSNPERDYARGLSNPPASPVPPNCSSQKTEHWLSLLARPFRNSALLSGLAPEGQVRDCSPPGLRIDEGRAPTIIIQPSHLLSLPRGSLVSKLPPNEFIDPKLLCQNNPL